MEDYYTTILKKNNCMITDCHVARKCENYKPEHPNQDHRRQ
jgi:hypothetical protein